MEGKRGEKEPTGGGAVERGGLESGKKGCYPSEPEGESNNEGVPLKKRIGKGKEGLCEKIEGLRPRKKRDGRFGGH